MEKYERNCRRECAATEYTSRLFQRAHLARAREILLGSRTQKSWSETGSKAWWVHNGLGRTVSHYTKVMPTKDGKDGQNPLLKTDRTASVIHLLRTRKIEKKKCPYPLAAESQNCNQRLLPNIALLACGIRIENIKNT
jgi:hypothetical protein